MYAQADLSFCSSHIPHCWKFHVAARLGIYCVACLATDASLTADPGVASSIPARSHTFVEVDHEIIYTVILLPSAESFKKGRYPESGVVLDCIDS